MHVQKDSINAQQEFRNIVKKCLSYICSYLSAHRSSHGIPRVHVLVYHIFQAQYPFKNISYLLYIDPWAQNCHSMSNS